MNTKIATVLIALSLKHPAQANKPIILWDIHNVLITRSGILTTLWNYGDWWNILRNSSFGLMKDLIILTATHIISGCSSEQFIQKARAHNNLYLGQLIMELTNAQQPIPGMQEIVDELHTAGYEQHVASNIGQTPFLALADKKQFPHLAPLFTHITLEKSLLVSNENGNFIKKPDPQFFKIYLQKNNLDTQLQPVIFVDDNANNVAAARQVGIGAILFEDPEQLRTELQKRNILIPNSDHQQTPKAIHL